MPSLVTEPLYVATVLLLLVVLAEWLGEKKYFHYLGSSLIVILAAALLANIHLLPSSQNASPLYDGIFTYIAPLAIFFLLLDVRLTDLKQAGLPMLFLFFTGAVTTVAGVLIGYHFIQPQHHSIEKAFAVAGMYTGTYIGGSANLNAVALQYGVTKNGTLFAAINAADNIITTIWIIATLVLPPLLQRWLPRSIKAYKTSKESDSFLHPASAAEQVQVAGLSLLLALGIGTLFLSGIISRWLPQVPAILFLTTIALLLAQVPAVQKLKGAKTLGYFFVLLFLAVVGAYCDVAALVHDGAIAFTLLIWVTVIVLVHGLLLFSIGGLLRQDWALISIASNANIGGAASAGVLATSLGRPDLRLPGILAGSVGNAIGTYVGILVAELLK